VIKDKFFYRDKEGLIFFSLNDKILGP